jgi:hypothetical protein
MFNQSFYHEKFLVTSYDARSGDKIAMQQFATFEVGMGGFGGARTSTAEIAAVAVPKRNPDAVVEQQTSPDQVFIIVISITLI